MLGPITASLSGLSKNSRPAFNTGLHEILADRFFRDFSLRRIFVTNTNSLLSEVPSNISCCIKCPKAIGYMRRGYVKYGRMQYDG